MNTIPSKVWLMRAGGHGEDEEAALSEERVIHGSRAIGDLSAYKDVKAIAKALSEVAASNENRAASWARQLWAFYSQAQVNDIVVLPLKTRPGQIALGRIKEPYEYAMIAGEYRHTRRVNWLRPDVARSTFKQDLLHSFGAFMTVCRIRRNNAEQRVSAVLAGQSDPGFEESSDATGSADLVEASDSAAIIDLAQAAQDEVVAYLRKQFKAHDLARLVGSVLEAEGYVTHVSPPGPDGGADILAGRGPLGLDGPTLCVQVKATAAAADVKILRELIGTMDSFKANQGLLVCWGGFTQPLMNEARQHSFKIRLWGEAEIVNAIYRVYGKLAPEVQAELPLKQIWMLVREDVSDE